MQQVDLDLEQWSVCIRMETFRLPFDGQVTWSYALMEFRLLLSGWSCGGSACGMKTTLGVTRSYRGALRVAV